MGKSSIEWTGSTWNPIRARNTATGQGGTHCVKISPGCSRCYAESHNHRNLPAGSSGLPYTAAGGAQAEYFIDPEMLAAPLRRKKPETYFVCSMTDIFMYPPEMVAALYGVMAAAPQHTFQVLTKRPEDALFFFAEARWGLAWALRLAHEILGGRALAAMSSAHPGATHWPPQNIWQGVSVENRKHGLPRIDTLRQIPAALRFLSVEPLLEDLGEIDLTGIGWVIVGGESGHGARPMHPEWVRSIRDQCVAAGVRFFFKQWGEWQNGSTQKRGRSEIVLADGRHGKTSQDLGWSLRGPDRSREWHALNPTMMAPVGKALAGRELDGREWSEMPETRP